MDLKKLLFVQAIKKKNKNYFKNQRNINVVDTGLKSESGSRIKLIKKYLDDDDDFFMTYGDGVSNINIKKLLKFHKKHKKIATLSAVRPLPRFGHLTIKNKKLLNLKKKIKFPKVGLMVVFLF